MSQQDEQSPKPNNGELPWQAQIVDSIHHLTERLSELAEVNTAAKNKETNW